MATYNQSNPEIKEDARNQAFTVGDRVEVRRVKALPNCVGTLEKKYTNSALISFTVGNGINQQTYEELNGRYVVNYDHLKVVKAEA